MTEEKHPIGIFRLSEDKHSIVVELMNGTKVKMSRKSLDDLQNERIDAGNVYSPEQEIE